MVENLKDQISLKFATNIIERLAYEVGVEASVSQSKDENFPRLLRVEITEEAELAERKSATCQATKFSYSFDMGIGAGILSIMSTFGTLLEKARSEAAALIGIKLGKGLKMDGIIPSA